MAYNEHPLTFIHYSIEWKRTVNSKRVARDTEPNLVLTSSAFWTLVRLKLEKFRHENLLLNKLLRADDTDVAVSATDRSERDPVKRFDELDIDWTIIEKRLHA